MADADAPLRIPPEEARYQTARARAFVTDLWALPEFQRARQAVLAITGGAEDFDMALNTAVYCADPDGGAGLSPLDERGRPLLLATGIPPRSMPVPTGLVLELCQKAGRPPALSERVLVVFALVMPARNLETLLALLPIFGAATLNTQDGRLSTPYDPQRPRKGAEYDERWRAAVLGDRHKPAPIPFQSRGRPADTKKQRGKLTPTNYRRVYRELQKVYFPSEPTQQDMADRFGVHKSTFKRFLDDHPELTWPPVRRL